MKPIDDDACAEIAERSKLRAPYQTPCLIVDRTIAIGTPIWVDEDEKLYMHPEDCRVLLDWAARQPERRTH